MAKIKLSAQVDVLYHNQNREKVTPADLAKVVERKLAESLEHEDADVTVVVTSEGR